MTTGTAERADAIPGTTGLRRHLPSFIAIGVASTVAYLVIYAALRVVLPSYAANTIAMAVTAVANTAANRRFTFEVHDASDSDRLAHQIKGGVAFLISLGLTNGGLWLLHASVSKPAHWVEMAVLVVANLVATATRYILMRLWVFKKS